MSDEVLLAKEILDHQLLDRDGRRCGNVDELELEGEPGGELRVVALLSGPGLFRRRLPRAARPLAWLLERAFGSGVTRLDWAEVASHDGAIELRGRAPDYGLGAGDDAAGRWIARVPGS